MHACSQHERPDHGAAQRRDRPLRREEEEEEEDIEDTGKLRFHHLERAALAALFCGGVGCACMCSVWAA